MSAIYFEKASKSVRQRTKGKGVKDVRGAHGAGVLFLRPPVNSGPIPLWTINVDALNTASNPGHYRRALGGTMKTVILLVISNIFMTLAWYGHLKYKSKPLVWVIMVSWAIAIFEYIFQVPANRLGSQTFTVTQLKIMQECITLAVFTVIAYFLFGETLKRNNVVSYALIVGAVFFSFGF